MTMVSAQFAADMGYVRGTDKENSMKVRLREKPQDGEKRVKRRFLIFPKTINRDFRWLEVATWEEQYGIREYFWGYDLG